jgi:hypothetical protein
MTLVDEFLNKTLSEMITRIRMGVMSAGDYRYLLTELILYKK